jgi:hypothetical protein
MIVKKEFELLKGTKNIISFSSGIMKAQSVEGDVLNVVRTIKLIENRINHFTLKRVSEITENLKVAKNNIHVVNMDYQLPVTYNTTTKKIVLNLQPFDVDEIAKVEPINVYASLAYGICLRNLTIGKYKIKPVYFEAISNWLNTVFVMVFGKEYGLLGAYSNEVEKLKFLIACYILDSFFGIKGDIAYKKAGALSIVDYKSIKNDLKKYDFSKINDLIKSLSDFRVMPGITKVNFLKKILQLFQGINFFPALEDPSRFFSSIVVASISGSNIVPTFISKKYNVDAFNKLLMIGKTIFK